MTTLIGLSVAELMAILYSENGRTKDLGDGHTISVHEDSYTVYDKRTSRALFTESGWRDLSQVSPELAAAVNKYESLNALRIAHIEQAKNNRLAGLNTDFVDSVKAARARVRDLLKQEARDE
jgi:hypothetical protein